MGLSLRIDELEAVINRCKTVQHSESLTLSEDMRRLARVYALMIYNHVAVLDVDELPDRVQVVIRTWLPIEQRTNADGLAACPFRPDDPDGACGACQ